jgi:hypothetical protein
MDLQLTRPVCEVEVVSQHCSITIYGSGTVNYLVFNVVIS